MPDTTTRMLAAIDSAIDGAPPQDRVGLSVGQVATRLRLGVPPAASGLEALPQPAKLAALRHMASLGNPRTDLLASLTANALADTAETDPTLAPLRLWNGDDPATVLAAIAPSGRLHALAQSLRWGAAPLEADLDRLIAVISEGARATAVLVWLHWRLARPEPADLATLTARVEAIDEPVVRLAALVDLAARREAPPTLGPRWATTACAAHPAAAAFHAAGVADCQLAMVLRLTTPAEAVTLLARARDNLKNLPQSGDRSLLFEALLPASAWTALDAWREAANTLVSDPILRRSPELFGQTAIRAAQSIEHLPDAEARDAGLGALLEVARSIAVLPLKLAFWAEAARWAARLPGRSPASLLVAIDADLDSLFGERLGLPLLSSIAASYAVADLQRALAAAERIRRPAHRALWLIAIADRLALGEMALDTV